MRMRHVETHARGSRFDEERFPARPVAEAQRVRWPRRDSAPATSRSHPRAAVKCRRSCSKWNRRGAGGFVGIERRAVRRLIGVQRGAPDVDGVFRQGEHGDRFETRLQRRPLRQPRSQGRDGLRAVQSSPGKRDVPDTLPCGAVRMASESLPYLVLETAATVA